MYIRIANLSRNSTPSEGYVKVPAPVHPKGKKARSSIKAMIHCTNQTYQIQDPSSNIEYVLCFNPSSRLPVGNLSLSYLFKSMPACFPQVT